MVALTSSTQTEDNPVYILLVDARQLVRAGIERVLSDSGYLTVSGAPANCDEAIRLVRRQQAQIIMVNLPGFSVDVLDGASKICRQFPDIPVLVFADESNLIIQERLLQAGVAGCVSSLCSVEELFAAIETVAPCHPSWIGKSSRNHLTGVWIRGLPCNGGNIDRVDTKGTL